MIILKEKIGEKVRNKSNEVGKITTVGTTVTISFDDGRTKKYGINIFSSGLFSFVDPVIQSKVSEGIFEEINANDTKAAEIAAKENSIKSEEKNKKLAAATAKRTSMFGANYNAKFLKQTVILTYKDVETLCNITIHGFGRGINVRKDSIILVSSIDTKNGSFTYHDTWDTNGDYLYSGEGSTGKQELTKGNKAIIDAKKDGRKIFLFVKTSPDEYLFQGEFIYIDHTTKNEADKEGNIRQEFIFRLRKIVDPENAINYL